MKGRRENILINCINESSEFIFCGNWNFKYTFTKANLQEHCSKYIQETKRIFYQKKITIIAGDKWRWAKRYLRHEEAAYFNEKNSFKLSAVENSTEISGHLRKWNFLSLIIKVYEGFLVRKKLLKDSVFINID